MCGRYALHAPMESLEAFLGCPPAQATWEPRYNVAPGARMPVVTSGPAGWRFQGMGWGFVPRWAKGDPGKRPINARSESAAEKPLFRQAFREGRCLVPASGFFEWRKDGPVRQPYYFHRVDGAPLLFAGLQDRWEGPEGAVETFAILTTRANGLMAPIHDRMPVILDPGAGHAWMDPSPGGAQALLELLRPCPEELLACHPVDPRVGNPRVEGPDLIRPAVGPRSLFP